jgi:hypothetical protein
MDTLKKIANSSWFRAAVAGAIGVFLLIDKNVLYAGIAFGIGIRELLLSLKK